MTPRPLCLACLAGILILSGCTAAHYRKSADKETTAAIAEKTPRVPNMDPHFTIEQTNVLSLEGLPVVTEVDGSLGSNAEIEKGAYILPLEKALEIAVHHSRIYQSRKENVYLQALALTLARHQFAPIFSGRGRADYQANTEQVLIGVDALTGQPRVFSAQDASIIEQNRVTGQSTVGVDLLLRTGARLAANFTTDFLRYLTGDPRVLTSSQLGATLTQPLLRGGGYKATVENLTQAERNLLYALRDFTRFRKDFSVQVATAYYRVLQNRDTVRNSWRGYQNFKRNVEREGALVEEGLRTTASLGQLEQAQLTTEAAWVNAIRSYKQTLDNFKIQLGLSTGTPIVLGDQELEQLKILHPDLAVDDSIRVARVWRLDLYNLRDQHEDTGRKIDLAANGLKPQLDLIASSGISSASEAGAGFPVPDINRYRWNAGLNLDLPLERKAQRNTYRAALIAHEQSSRTLQEAYDVVTLQIREDWRNLDQAKRNYEIAELGVKLAERRLEEQELRAEVGRGTARDLVDAQNDLITSKNARTQALVNHTIARLQFWNDMGILFIKENGRWEEMSDVKHPPID